MAALLAATRTKVSTQLHAAAPLTRTQALPSFARAMSATAGPRLKTFSIYRYV